VVLFPGDVVGLLLVIVLIVILVRLL